MAEKTRAVYDTVDVDAPEGSGVVSDRVGSYEVAQAKRGRPTQNFKQTEVGLIPADWIVYGLQQVCRENITYGIVQCGPHIPNGIPYIRVSDMEDGELDVQNMLRTSSVIANKFSRSIVEVGDLVYALRGQIGEVKLVHPNVAGANLTQGTARLSPSKLLTSQYFLWAMRSPTVLGEALKDAKGSTFREITLAELRSLPILVPPTKAEQQAIASALSDVDELLGALDRLIAKKRDLKQAAMQELLTSKRRLPGFTKPWETKKFGDLAKPRSERVDPRRSGAQTFCVDLDGLESGSGRLLHSGEAGTGASIKTCFRRGDVLFGKLRAYLRKYWKATRDGVCSTEIWALAALPDIIDPEYLFDVVQQQFFIDAASIAYGTHMPRADWKVMRELDICLPSDKDEQAAIANILSDMEEEIAALESRREKTRLLKQGMMQELLTGRIRLMGPEVLDA